MSDEDNMPSGHAAMHRYGKIALMIAGTLAVAAAVYFAFAGASDDAASPAGDAARDADRAVAAAGLSDEERAAMEAVVRDYILTHPEIIPEAVGILQDREASARVESVREKAETPFRGAWTGAENGDVTLVKFSDFSCGYCRASVPDVTRLLKEDAGLRVVFRELPILSPQSESAARWALAAAEQGKYYPFYRAMFAGGRVTDSSIEAAAQEAGLDMGAARKFVENAAVTEEIGSNMDMARTLQVTGTPAWIVGDRLMIGAVGYEELKSAVAEARAD